MARLRISLSLRTVLLFFLLLAMPATNTAGQNGSTDAPIRISPAATSDVIVNLLEQGRALEVTGRWGEALSHYEQALLEHPGNRTLVSQLDLAKIHFSLERRFHNPSFAKSLAMLSARSADQLYAEVLLKINTHYVAPPNWAKLVIRGTMAVDVALADVAFCRKNVSELSRQRIDQFRRQMYQVAGAQPIRTRHDARQAVATTAAHARRQLGISEAAVMLEYIAGAMGGLDNYSDYLSADQLKDVYSQIEGNFVGLGVELKANNGDLLIVHVISGSPAQRAGIKADDRIVAVDSHATRELSTDAAASLLQGKEGSTVTLTMVTPGQSPRHLTVRRQNVDVPSVEDVKIIDPDFQIGYIKLPSFQKTTSRDLDLALWNLHGQGMRSLILDLRGNPGGLLTASVEVADKFIKQGPIVSTRGRNAEEDFNYVAHEQGTWTIPLVVLIDGDSASASEIFAGAISDHHRGTVVGTRSYGKGSVQGIFPLSITGAGVRLTTARFFSPHGHAISKVGITPDIDPHLTARVPVGENVSVSKVAASHQDIVLDAGLQVIRRPLASR